MAAYNYYPATYQPYGQFYYPMNYQQPVMPQTVMPQQTMQNTQQQTAQNYSPAVNQSSIIWISGEQEAQMYPIAPNNAVALWEKSGKTIYLKQADATGKPTMTVYDLVERSQTAQNGATAQSDKSVSYATKDELSAVAGTIHDVNSMISALKGDIETIKGDMYGIAGKKKPVKKENEDDA